MASGPHEYRNPKTGEFIGWKICWRESGKQRSKLHKVKEDAVKFKAQVEAGVADTSRPGKPVPSILFRDFVLDQWLPNSGLAANSQKNYRSVLNTQLKPLHDQTVAWVASHRAEVQAVINASTRKATAESHAVVQSACDEAVALGLIDHHSLTGIATTTGDDREIVLATPEQLQAIAEGLPDSLVLWCGSGLGTRPSETLGLRGADFRDQFRTVRVQRQAINGEPARVKNHKSTPFRDVPVSTELGKLIKARVQAQGTGALFPGGVKQLPKYPCPRCGLPTTSVYGMCSRPGECREESRIRRRTRSPEEQERERHTFVRYDAFISQFRPAAIKAGPYEYADGTPAASFTPHMLRHIFATEMLTAGIELSTVAKWLGDTTETVDRTYSHLLPDRNEAGRKALDAAWKGPK